MTHQIQKNTKERIKVQLQIGSISMVYELRLTVNIVLSVLNVPQGPAYQSNLYPYAYCNPYQSAWQAVDPYTDEMCKQKETINFLHSLHIEDRN